MTDTVENLILDLVEWVGWKECIYEETIEAWAYVLPEVSRLGGRDGKRTLGDGLCQRTVARWFEQRQGLTFLKEKRPHAYEGL